MKPPVYRTKQMAKPGGPKRARAARLPELVAAVWLHVRRVLAATQGNVTVAARRLAIDRRTLQRMISRGAPAAGSQWGKSKHRRRPGRRAKVAR